MNTLWLPTALLLIAVNCGHQPPHRGEIIVGGTPGEFHEFSKLGGRFVISPSVFRLDGPIYVQVKLDSGECYESSQRGDEEVSIDTSTTPPRSKGRAMARCGRWPGEKVEP
jgi:hypothetical protein